MLLRRSNASDNAKKHDDEVLAKTHRILKDNPGRKPSWSEDRLQQVCNTCQSGPLPIVSSTFTSLWAWDRSMVHQMDKMALEQRKRCIMWDDEGPGFYLVRQQRHNRWSALFWPL